MDWLAVIGACLDLDGLTIFLRKGIDRDSAAPLLASHGSMAAFRHEHGTVQSLKYAGSVCHV